MSNDFGPKQSPLFSDEPLEREAEEPVQPQESMDTEAENLEEIFRAQRLKLEQIKEDDRFWADLHSGEPELHPFMTSEQNMGSGEALAVTLGGPEEESDRQIFESGQQGFNMDFMVPDFQQDALMPEEELKDAGIQEEGYTDEGILDFVTPGQDEDFQPQQVTPGEMDSFREETLRKQAKSKKNSILFKKRQAQIQKSEQRAQKSISLNSKAIQKKKGPPFKGDITDNTPERNVKVRRAIMRQFSAFFQNPAYQNAEEQAKEVEEQKKRKKFVKAQNLEQENFEKCEQDCVTLFSTDGFWKDLPKQEKKALQEKVFMLKFTHHYKKYKKWDFGLLRDPMYKYSKEAKERLLKTPLFAFLFCTFSSLPEFHKNLEETPGQAQRSLILQELAIFAFKELQERTGGEEGEGQKYVAWLRKRFPGRFDSRKVESGQEEFMQMPQDGCEVTKLSE